MTRPSFSWFMLFEALMLIRKQSSDVRNEWSRGVAERWLRSLVREDAKRSAIREPEAYQADTTARFVKALPFDMRPTPAAVLGIANSVVYAERMHLSARNANDGTGSGPTGGNGNGAGKG